MQKLISAKWIILLTVLINVVTTFTVVTIFPSRIWVANASKTNCVVNRPIFQAFKDSNGGTYNGIMRANSGGNHVIAHMTITFTGSAPTSGTDRGTLSAVVFSATAEPGNSFNFQDIKSDGNGLDTNKVTALSDFTVKLTDGGTIHFINGSFTGGQKQQIVGLFDVTGGKSDGANGSWIVQ